ncbi:MAG: FAD-dependent oxidoreductase [Euzebyaceae bacterium]|nr:FAD-dependent oxidoreductase [Euzebyaceae bacterium]
MNGNYWSATVPARQPQPLAGELAADVVVIGGGYTGLWTALTLVERNPLIRVVVCERDTVGFGASGRNGGFLDPSLTHGPANGLAHFPDEIDRLQRLADDNYAGMVDFFARHEIACDFEATGMLDVAVAAHQVDELRDSAQLYRRHGERAEFLDADEVAEHLRSPKAMAGLHRPDAGGVLNPARLAAELARVASAAGVAIHERTPVTGVKAARGGVVATTPAGKVHASSAVLATNAYSGQTLRRTNRHYIPVHDYILVTEPLAPDLLASLGWKRRQGVGDAGNQFHYFRLTADDRLLWGGYDAIYAYGSGVGPRFDQRPETFARLHSHLSQMFPTLRDVAIDFAWGGPIATTTRFTPVFGEALGGRLVYALGYTGLGVSATRFAARVLADRLTDPGSALLSLRYVRKAPFPFPPEPLRWAAVTLVRRALASADHHGGRRGLLLRTLDAAGIGFDS